MVSCFYLFHSAYTHIGLICFRQLGRRETSYRAAISETTRPQNRKQSHHTYSVLDSFNFQLNRFPNPLYLHFRKERRKHPSTVCPQVGSHSHSTPSTASQSRRLLDWSQMMASENWSLSTMRKWRTQKYMCRSKSQFWEWSTSTTLLSCPSSTDQSKPLSLDSELLSHATELKKMPDISELRTETISERKQLLIARRLLRTFKSRVAFRLEDKSVHSKRWVSKRFQILLVKCTRRTTTHRSRLMFRELGCTNKIQEYALLTAVELALNRLSSTIMQHLFHLERACMLLLINLMTLQEPTEEFARMLPSRKTRSSPRSESKLYSNAIQ